VVTTVLDAATSVHVHLPKTRILLPLLRGGITEVDQAAAADVKSSVDRPILQPIAVPAVLFKCYACVLSPAQCSYLAGNLQNSVTVPHATPPPPSKASRAAQLVLILRWLVLLAVFPATAAAAAASCASRSAALNAPVVKK
jgi:hypothetical protein